MLGHSSQSPASASPRSQGTEVQSDFLYQTLFFAAGGVPPSSLLVPASQHPLSIWGRTCCYRNWLWMLRMLPGSHPDPAFCLSLPCGAGMVQ